MTKEPIVISGAENIDRARLLIMRAGLKLEVAGMTNRGMSCYQMAKREFGFKGSKKSVLEQLTNYINTIQ
jgi:hypothetical protein|tara:strand:+ start:441 stop:650 length:210 start_codon:yes stop_codon:yes gene_type:complete